MGEGAKVTAKRQLGPQAFEQKNLFDKLNRELVPYVKQITPGTVITGSRSAGTTVLEALLQVLQNAGIITDKTTP